MPIRHEALNKFLDLGLCCGIVLSPHLPPWVFPHVSLRLTRVFACLQLIKGSQNKYSKRNLQKVRGLSEPSLESHTDSTS